MFSLIFFKLVDSIRVNLTHLSLAYLLLYGLSLSLWCFSILVNYYFQAFFSFSQFSHIWIKMPRLDSFKWSPGFHLLAELPILMSLELFMKLRHLVFSGVNIFNKPTRSIIYQPQVPLARKKKNKNKIIKIIPSCCYTFSGTVFLIRSFLTVTVWMENK